MIDIQLEVPISFAEATRMLPRRRGGKRPHVATLYRWTQSGCRGIRLESIQIGGTRCTSVEALQRFFDQLTTDADQPSPNVSTHLTPSRRRHLEAINRELDRAGF